MKQRFPHVVHRSTSPSETGWVCDAIARLYAPLRLPHVFVYDRTVFDTSLYTAGIEVLRYYARYFVAKAMSIAKIDSVPCTLSPVIHEAFDNFNEGELRACIAKACSETNDIQQLAAQLETYRSRTAKQYTLYNMQDHEHAHYVNYIIRMHKNAQYGATMSEALRSHKRYPDTNKKDN